LSKALYNVTAQGILLSDTIHSVDDMRDGCLFDLYCFKLVDQSSHKVSAEV